VRDCARNLRRARRVNAAHLKPNGAYDGWLLSTANGLAPQLRAIAKMVADGAHDQATAASGDLTKLVEALFGAADGLPSGNPFSNANRAVDHVLAYGSNWRSTPARLASGDILPEAFLAAIQDLLSKAGIDTATGYAAPR